MPNKNDPHSTALTPIPFHEIGDLARETARDRLLTAFEEQGVTRELMAAVGAELLQAEKVKVHWDKGEPGQTDDQGRMVDPGTPPGFRYSKPLADNTTRYNTLKLLMDFHDVMPSKRVDIEDKRQTKNLANALISRITQMGVVGVEDVEREVDGPSRGEMALMGEMVKGGRPAMSTPPDTPRPQPASLNPMDMEEDL